MTRGRGTFFRVREGLSRAYAGWAAQASRIPVPAVIWALTGISLYLAYRHALPCADAVPDDTETWRRACYNDIQPLYGGRLLDQGAVPYLHYELPPQNGHNVEYPALTGAFMALVGLPVQALHASGRLEPILHALGFQTVDAGLVFFWVTTAVLGVLALAVTRGLLLCRRARPWDVALWAAAPALVLHATINWDLLAVALTVAALVAWSRNRPGWAGALLGLGTAAKLFPLVILGPLVLLCLRAGTPRARRAAVRLVTSAAGAWTVVNIPLMLVNRDGWAYPYRFSTGRWIDWGTLWFTLDQITGAIGLQRHLRDLIGNPADLNKASLVLFGLCCAGIAVLIWVAPRPPRVGAMAFLVVGAFLLTNKVWSPQFVLWLVPLYVLARPRWGWFLLWQGAEVTYLFSVMRAVLGQRDGFALDLASGLRWVAVAVLCGLVVLEAIHPDRDVVRIAGLDDPEGGVLNRTGRSSRALPRRRMPRSRVTPEGARTGDHSHGGNEAAVA